ncbi:hypothetical protein [Coleofasciculus sp. E2-BRE-01]
MRSRLADSKRLIRLIFFKAGEAGGAGEAGEAGEDGEDGEVNSKLYLTC